MWGPTTSTFPVRRFIRYAICTLSLRLGALRRVADCAIFNAVGQSGFGISKNAAKRDGGKNAKAPKYMALLLPSATKRAARKKFTNKEKRKQKGGKKKSYGKEE